MPRECAHTEDRPIEERRPGASRGERVVPLSRQAHERIREMIAEGRLPPNVVIREIDLVRECGMSRTPIREALHRLAAEGLIRPVAAGGFVAVELGPKELVDIYQVREVLVALAARLAAQHRSRVDVARLEDALEALDGALAANARDDADDLIRQFYHVIGEASGNEFLRSTLGRITDLFRYRALVVAHPESRDPLGRAHRELVDAIAAQDAERAERVAKALIASSLQMRLEIWKHERGVRCDGAAGAE